MTWQKGQSGNPKGRAKADRSITAALREYAEGSEDGKPRVALLAMRLWDLTLAEDESTRLNAIRYVFDRLDGKIPDSVNVNQSGKLVVEVVRVPGRAKSSD